MKPRSFAASLPADSAPRPEPSLASSPQHAPRLVARPPAIDLRAGERAVVASTLGGPAGLDPKLVRRVGLGVLVLLALVGAASLLRGTLGL